MQRIAFVLALALCALPAGPARAQATSLQELFSGKQRPLTMKLKDLNSEWRCVSLTGQFDLGGSMQAFASVFASMFGGSASAAYYTRGETVTLNGETYLVAYRVQTPPTSFLALMQSAQPPVPPKLTPETPLALCLLNLRTSGSFTDIRPFNLEEEIAASERLAASASAAMGGG